VKFHLQYPHHLSSFSILPYHVLLKSQFSLLNSTFEGEISEIPVFTPQLVAISAAYDEAPAPTLETSGWTSGRNLGSVVFVTQGAFVDDLPSGNLT